MYPAFSAPTTVVAVVDVAGYNSGPNPLTLGEMLTVTDGTIPETTTVTFKDGSSLSPDPTTILTTSIIDSLPSYTGTVTVDSFDTFTAVPEPSGLLLLGVGIASVLALAYGRKTACSCGTAPAGGTGGSSTCALMLKRSTGGRATSATRRTRMMGSWMIWDPVSPGSGSTSRAA